MTGFDEGDAPNGEGAQETYLPPDVPEGYVLPPSGTQFANATWLRAGSEINRYVEEVLAFDEFDDIRELDYEVTWRRNSKPMRGDAPIFASVEVVAPRIIWESYQQGNERFPRFFVDLHWSHFDDLRRGKTPGEPERKSEEQTGGQGAQYVHHGILQQHLHHALSSLSVENDIIHRRPPDFMGYAATVKRFGQWNEGIVQVSRQLRLFDQEHVGERPLHVLAQD